VENNKFYRPEPFIFTSTRKATDEDDVFHYVSYVWSKGNIYEIDGLREGPIIISENVTYEDWVNKVKPAILDRINLYANNEIKFNLLALVPDKREKLSDQMQEQLKRKAYISRLLITEDKSGIENVEVK
jgi:ubiquitin carboxyl-terminal hydrolase L5